MKIDFHIHSNFSDGANSPEEIIRKAEHEKFDAIAISDHNTMKGYHEAKKIKTKTKIIPSVEVTTNYGHILCIGLENPKFKKRMDALKLISYIKRRGGVTIAAHPFGGSLRPGLPESLLKKVDAIEVVNGKTFPSKNLMATKAAIKLKKPFISSSDAHILSEIGKFYTLVPGRNQKEILANIKKGKTKIGIQSTTISEVLMKTLKSKIRKLLK